MITLLFLSNFFLDAIRPWFHNQLKLLLEKCLICRFIILIFYFLSRELPQTIASITNTYSVHISWYLFMKGTFWRLNLIKSLALNLLLFHRLWESFFIQFYPDSSFAIVANILRSYFDTSVVKCIVSWRISIYFLVFFFVKYRSMIPFMVRFNHFTICAFRSLCVANSFMS